MDKFVSKMLFIVHMSEKKTKFIAICVIIIIYYFV